MTCKLTNTMNQVSLTVSLTGLGLDAYRVGYQTIEGTDQITLLLPSANLGKREGYRESETTSLLQLVQIALSHAGQ